MRVGLGRQMRGRSKSLLFSLMLFVNPFMLYVSDGLLHVLLSEQFAKIFQSFFHVEVLRGQGRLSHREAMFSQGMVRLSLSLVYLLHRFAIRRIQAVLMNENLISLLPATLLSLSSLKEGARLVAHLVLSTELAADNVVLFEYF